MSFIDDSLLKANDNIQHHGESPTLENMIVLSWLRLIHTDLLALVKQRYGTELRSKTLASLKQEVLQALDSLLEEIESTNEAKILRTAFQRPNQRDTTKVARHKGMQKSCPLCKQAKRPHSQTSLVSVHSYQLKIASTYLEHDKLSMIKIHYLMSTNLR